MATLIDRFKSSWNAFRSREPTETYSYEFTYNSRPDRPRFSGGNRQSIVASVYNLIANDVAALDIRHSRIDINGQYTETINSGLNYCLNEEANIDQTGREFIQDVVISMLDEGVVAIVPVDATNNAFTSGQYDIKTLRTAKVLQWYPNKVRVKIYDDRVGVYKEILVPKTGVAIIQNPLYAIMNEPNSTLQRLVRKINLLDAIDEQASSGKLNMIIQLPYVIKTEAKRKEAEKRRKEIEEQLANSKYGIAYTDGTERITQINRAIESNLLDQVKYLTTMFYNQLGLSESIFNGTADESTTLAYYNRTIEPIVAAIVDNINRKFLTKTARTQGQKITFHRDPFRLVPVDKLADIADRFTRNEILSSNEVRGIIGYKPSNDPRADELRNKNINETAGSGYAPGIQNEAYEMEDGYYDPTQEYIPDG